MSFLAEKLGLPSLSSLLPRSGGGGLGQLHQALRSGFGDFMQNAPMQALQRGLPGFNSPTPAARPGGGNATPAPAGNGMPAPANGAGQGTAPGFTTPSGVFIPAPPGIPLPGGGQHATHGGHLAAHGPGMGGPHAGHGNGAGFTTPSGHVIPSPPTLPFSAGGQHAAHGGLPTAHGPGAGGPQTGPGNIVGNTINAVLGALRPGGTQPPAMPTPTTPGATNSPAAPTQTLGNLANAVLAPVRALLNGGPVPPAVSPANTLGNAVNAVPAPASTVPGSMLAAPGAGAAHNAANTASTAVPPQSPATVLQGPQGQAQAAPATTAAPQAPLPQASSPVPTGPAQQAAAQVQPGPTAMPMQTAAQPQRADAGFVPAGTQAADRGAVPMQAPATQAAVPNAPQGATLLAAVPVATTIAQTPAGQQVAGNTQIAGNTQSTAPVAGEKGGPSRAELPMVGVYTAEGPELRRRNRIKVGAQQLGEWLVAFAHGRPHLVRPRDDTPNEITRAFQWLFWTLAIVAYGCLGLVLVSFLLSFGDIPAAPAMRRWTGEFALAGLVAAVGAWWLGRHILAPHAAPRTGSTAGKPPA
ncbi:hypothetical protein LDO26_14855 [Luteimonas sp. BDR2-5]|uniref:hypothetical protein n=1 Tax=Proluteimonas luteida TaxID=2878685 RepID=UPI001E484FCA|nr:hypothetical protein [Luteimonas sp. BDR2-5]MCD9029472.1 hypothetical protein [Luteimonas sp. BDR2-5]